MEPIQLDIFTLSEEDLAVLEPLLRRFAPSSSPPRRQFTLEVDADQRAFVESDRPLIRLLAPAGSGKTQSIANRVMYGVNSGTPLESYLLLTFDNAAALSLRSRLTAGFQDSDRTVQPRVHTLNSFGNSLLFGLLRDSVGGLSLGENPAKTQDVAMRRVLKDIQYKHAELADLLPRNLKRRVYLDLVSYLKNNLIDARRLGEVEARKNLLTLLAGGRLLDPWLAPFKGSADLRTATIRVINALMSVYVQYDAVLKGDGHIDFDDQKLLPYHLLRESPKLQAAATARFSEVIVDEFQDINRLDFELIRLLAKGKKLTVVGDDDQAIYGFRGCSPAYIIDFERLCGAPVHTCVLSTNYRCPKNVVETSTALIRQNTYRVEKHPVAHSTTDADIDVWHGANSASEAKIISRQIRQIVDTSNATIGLGDVAVLFRMNSQSLPLQLSLIVEGIPYHCRKEDNIILSDTMQRILDLVGLHLRLREAQDFVDRPSARLLCDCYFRFSPDDLSRQLVAAASTGRGFVEGANRLAGTGKFTAAFTRAIDGLLSNQTPERLLLHIGESFPNVGGLIGTLEDAVENRVPLAELVDVASRFRGTTQEFYEHLHGLLQQARGGLYHSSPEAAVNLLTYFRSKGRQWHTVFLPGVNQRVIPHVKAPIEDERRLMYVAVTRATANLRVSYVRTAVGDKVAISQFIGEMGLGPGRERRAAAGSL